MKLYNNSLVKVLSSVYPTHHWLPWRFAKLPTGWWKLQNNQLQFVEWVRKQSGYEALEDLYRLTNKSFSELGGSFN